MIRHYLSLAWQQLEKYRLQSVVSIVSLAIGFACFALASMWIKYETTYDAFHRDAERIHFLIRDASDVGEKGEVLWDTYKVFCDTIYKYCPEIVEHTQFVVASASENKLIAIDSSFLDFFDIRILQGSNAFLRRDGGYAITQEKAREIWGDENPVGKELELSQSVSLPIVAVVEGIGGHTNIPFDLLCAITPDAALPLKYAVRFAPTARLESINMRIDTLYISYSSTIKVGDNQVVTSSLSAEGGFEFIPATEFRHRFFDKQMAVQINHIYLFALAGGLLILCGLLNYLTMFLNRLFIRQREIALRTVFGATGRDLTMQFLVEYGLVLLIAFSLGLFLMEGVLPSFRHLAELPEGTGFIYREGLVCLLVVMAVSLLISSPVIRFFRRQALQNSIQNRVGLFSYSNFRKLSICLQISISLLFFFCTVVMMKQIDTLRHTDIGFERKDMGIIEVDLAESISGSLRDWIDRNSEMVEEAYAYLKQQPDVTEVVRNIPISPASHLHSVYEIGKYDLRHEQRMREFGKEKDASQHRILRNPDLVKEVSSFMVIKDFDGSLSRFYNFQLLEGRFIEEGDDERAILLNESAVRQFHWDSPIGKEIYIGGWSYHVVGVIKDFLNYGPTTPAKPFLILKVKDESIFNCKLIFKYRPGTWEACKEKFSEHFKQNPSIRVEFQNVEEEYEKLLESEKNLQMLLCVTAGTCILIALFGVWSMIMLTCEQRRKEIAVRKVFGATVKDILDMFIVEYMSLQAVAALVAFPIGYACMKPWLEQYVVQTEIPWWIYVGIFLLVALLVALCIGWRVWKTATAHPADEICKG